MRVNGFRMPLVSLCYLRGAQMLDLSFRSTIQGPPSHAARRRFTRPTNIWMMPEGPEVKTTIDRLQGGVGRRLVDIQFLSGRYVRNGRPDGFDAFASSMTPVFQPHEPKPATVDMVEEINAKGKFVYIKLDDGINPPESSPDYGRSIWATLGMSGRFKTEEKHNEDPRFARWYLEFLNVTSGARSRVFYHDQRNFGTLKFSTSNDELDGKLAKLGPDILDPSTTDEECLEVMNSQRQTMNVCKFLMDQSKLSGIGNYILSECLYRAVVDPFASLDELTEEQRMKVIHEAREVARESYWAQSDQGPPDASFELQCYGRQTTQRGELVLRETNGPHKRSIWYTERQLFMPLKERLAVAPAKSSTAASLPSEPTASIEAEESDWNQDLITGLKDPQWKSVLADTIQSSSFEKLSQFLREEHASGATIYPPLHQVFSALNLCPFEKVKVVIVGQDPYHGPGQGHGLAFSVQPNVKIPPSLRNIFLEAQEDGSMDSPNHQNGNLESWARQGVLLLNSILTVRRGEAGSHKNQGWEDVTDTIISKLNDESNSGLVFLLWGAPAAKKAAMVDETKHVVIRTSHPSPLGARKTASPFLGSRCFSRCNDALESFGKSPIDWNVP